MQRTGGGESTLKPKSRHWPPPLVLDIPLVSSANVSEQPPKLLCLHLDVLQNLSQQAGADGLTRVNRHHGATPIRMPHEVVAALGPQDLEACAPQRRDDLAPTQSR